MATGWARDGAVQEQIDASIDAAVQRARRGLPSGDALVRCEDCGIAIPEARRRTLPGVRRCVSCQTSLDEADGRRNSGHSRRRNPHDRVR